MAIEQPNTRLYLIAQHDHRSATGFCLELGEGKLNEVPLVLGVGDGTEWRFLQHRSGFVPDRLYQVRVVLSAERAQLFLDGVLVGESPGRWQPAAGALTANRLPERVVKVHDWLPEVGPSVVVLHRGGEEVTRQQFDGSRRRPAALELFQAGGPPQWAEFAARPGDTVAIELSITFVAHDLHALAPLIDRYGQCRAAEWPAKVRSDEEFRHDIGEEAARLAAMPPSPDFDSYGGYRKAGWREEGSGFFRVTKRDGFWWLISPEGNPTFYLGMNSAHREALVGTPVAGREFLFEWLPDRTGRYASGWHYGNDWTRGENLDYVSFYECNLIRKYGDSWQRDAEEAQVVRRLRSWGFSGGGKWGTPAVLVDTPVLHHGGVDLVRHPDVFDPAARATLRAELAEQITPRRNDPLVLGWALGSEWDELIEPEEVTGILRMGARVPAKRALLDYALETRYAGSLERLNAAWGTPAKTREQLYQTTPNPPSADAEAMRLYYADKYYEYVYQTVKSIDPNHLYIGSYINHPWTERGGDDWRLAGRHTDVISYDDYPAEYCSDWVWQMEAELDKPTFDGEFSYPPYHDGERGFGRYGVGARDDVEAGEKYRAWVQAAARDPHCVGGIWFEYLDQSITGQGGHDYGASPIYYVEHYAFGLIGVTDRPKWEMITKMREANLQAAEWRMAAARQR
jgi:hypothetical protein